LDEVKSRKSETRQKRVLNASLPFTNEMIHRQVLSFGQNNKQIFPAKNQKKKLFLSSLLAFFFVLCHHFPLKRSIFAQKIEENISGNGNQRNFLKTSARKQNTAHTRKKKETARTKSTQTRASKGTR